MKTEKINKKKRKTLKKKTQDNSCNVIIKTNRKNTKNKNTNREKKNNTHKITQKGGNRFWFILDKIIPAEHDRSLDRIVILIGQINYEQIYVKIKTQNITDLFNIIAFIMTQQFNNITEQKIIKNEYFTIEFNMGYYKELDDKVTNRYFIKETASFYDYCISKKLNDETYNSEIKPSIKKWTYMYIDVEKNKVKNHSTDNNEIINNKKRLNENNKCLFYDDDITIHIDDKWFSQIKRIQDIEEIPIEKGTWKDLNKLKPYITTNIENLWLLATTRYPDNYVTIRDLEGIDSINLCKKFKSHLEKAAWNYYGVHPEQLRIFFHYPANGGLHAQCCFSENLYYLAIIDYTHLISTVIDNLELDHKYYKKITLNYSIIYNPVKLMQIEYIFSNFEKIISFIIPTTEEYNKTLIVDNNKAIVNNDKYLPYNKNKKNLSCYLYYNISPEQITNENKKDFWIAQLLLIQMYTNLITILFDNIKKYNENILTMITNSIKKINNQLNNIKNKNITYDNILFENLMNKTIIDAFELSINMCEPYINNDENVILTDNMTIQNFEKILDKQYDILKNRIIELNFRKNNVHIDTAEIKKNKLKAIIQDNEKITISNNIKIKNIRELISLANTDEQRTYLNTELIHMTKIQNTHEQAQKTAINSLTNFNDKSTTNNNTTYKIPNEELFMTKQNKLNLFTPTDLLVPLKKLFYENNITSNTDWRKSPEKNGINNTWKRAQPIPNSKPFF